MLKSKKALESNWENFGDLGQYNLEKSMKIYLKNLILLLIISMNGWIYVKLTVSSAGCITIFMYKTE